MKPKQLSVRALSLYYLQNSLTLCDSLSAFFRGGQKLEASRLFHWFGQWCIYLHGALPGEAVGGTVEGHDSTKVSPSKPSHSLDWWQQKLGCSGAAPASSRPPGRHHRCTNTNTTTTTRRPTSLCLYPTNWSTGLWPLTDRSRIFNLDPNILQWFCKKEDGVVCEWATWRELGRTGLVLARKRQAGSKPGLESSPKPCLPTPVWGDTRQLTQN